MLRSVQPPLEEVVGNAETFTVAVHKAALHLLLVRLLIFKSIRDNSIKTFSFIRPPYTIGNKTSIYCVVTVTAGR